MTELARTPSRLRRLFQIIDFAPLPQHRYAAQGLDAWRELRGSQLAPSTADMLGHQTRNIADHSLLAEPIAGKKDFMISQVGMQARLMLQPPSSRSRLSQVGYRRIAARLRRLFHLVLEYGEPVDVRFVEGDRAYEVLAAPVRASNGRTSLFCTIAVDELPPRPA
jgi:hypothetical protein